MKEHVMKKTIFSLLCLAIFSLSGIANAEFLADPEGDIANVGVNGHLDVSIGDQTTPPLIVDMSRVTNTTTLTTATAINDTTIVVASATGFVDGAMITIADPVSGRYWIGHQIGAIATLTVTVDTPLDFAFPIATAEVAVGTHELSSTAGTLASPVIYSVRAGEQSDVPTTIDVTRIIFTCTADQAVDLTNFCGITALTNGIVLRRVDGTTQNIFNVKSIGDLANIMYDTTVYSASNPQQGVNGMVGRLTFGGQSKMGVVIRIGPGEDLELLVQDDLTGISTFKIVAEGHVVQPN
jgi:hypothetical protein